MVLGSAFPSANISVSMCDAFAVLLKEMKAEKGLERVV